jgi:transposase
LMSPETSRAEAESKKRTDERRGTVLDILRELLAEGRSEEVLALFGKLVARNSELERRLSELLTRRRTSEGVSSAQLKLLLDELGAGEETATSPELGEADRGLRAASGIDENKGEEPKEAPRRKQPRLRRPIPAHLRRVDNEIRVPEDKRPCPVCGTERRCIGHDITEVIELIPAEVVVRRDLREKLACDTCEGELVRAPMGDKVVSGGRLGSRLVAELLVDKYRDGLPLHRVKERLARMGLELSVATLSDQVRWSTELWQPLWRVSFVKMLKAKVMHLDGTGLMVLERGSAGGKKLGALWGYVGDEIALYLYASTGKRAGQRPGELGPEDVLKLREGYTVADASSLFDRAFLRPELIECGCNMHARRYFAKALDGGDARAALPIAAFKKLYEIEAEVRGQGDDTTLAARQTKSKPVYDELVTWCETYKPHEPPSSPLGAAIRYLTNHKVALMRFLEDAAIPIDNGAVERLHVRTALTRKNFLFAGSDAGAERAAIAYTILGSCALAGVNPVEYLADVLPCLARKIRLCDIPDLLPARWKTLREGAHEPVEPHLPSA